MVRDQEVGDRVRCMESQRAGRETRNMMNMYNDRRRRVICYCPYYKTGKFVRPVCTSTMRMVIRCANQNLKQTERHCVSSPNVDIIMY